MFKINKIIFPCIFFVVLIVNVGQGLAQRQRLSMRRQPMLQVIDSRADGNPEASQFNNRDGDDPSQDSMPGFPSLPIPTLAGNGNENGGDGTDSNGDNNGSDDDGSDNDDDGSDNDDDGSDSDDDGSDSDDGGSDSDDDGNNNGDDGNDNGDGSSKNGDDESGNGDENSSEDDGCSGFVSCLVSGVLKIPEGILSGVGNFISDIFSFIF